MSRSTSQDSDFDLFQQARPDLIAMAERILGSRALAEEVVQDSWLRWRDSASRARVGQAFVRTIVRNLALDRLRKERAEASRRLVAEVKPISTTCSEEILIHRQHLEIASTALAELAPRTRRAFELRRLEGRSLAEVAAELDVSVPRAHQLVCRALAHIAQSLKE